MASTDPPTIETVALHEATRERYLNYALSVITARALPDVRDGLKPVQRRILYAMYANLRLRPDERYRKSAAVVGEVMAKYHPHGDSSIYEAMVRMAQPFSLLHPLVDGQGNFGSLDGDGAAAMRYTECKLQPIAMELLDEIKQQTVDFRPNYDGQHEEPVVLPAEFPQLLVNGTEGIAVGMATKIPPHNLREVIDACCVLIDDPEADVATLCKKLKGPDFPTGGLILNNRTELREIYETGGGSVRLRGKWELEKSGRKDQVIITEIPYALNKATLVEKIGALVAERKVPQLVDVRDESAEDIRIVCELRSRRASNVAVEVDAEAAMAYLCKNTPLEGYFHVNLTCLVPSENPFVGSPEKVDLRRMLTLWLEFRYATVRRRFEYELRQLLDRIHILEGFCIIFDALDEAIRLIRASEGKADARERLIARFDLSDIQADAVLELQLYRLAKLSILAIREELEEKRARAARIQEILASPRELWAVVRDELQEIRKTYGQQRRTTVGGAEAEELEFDEAAYIVDEDSYVIVTRDGWIKRQQSFTGIDKIRIREGDSIGWIALGSARRTVTFYTDQGSAYVMRVDDVPSTTGYGEPVQRHFKFSDGERVVGVLLSDPRSLPKIPAALKARFSEEETPPPWGVAVTRRGRCLRFDLANHSEPSTRAGRKYMKPERAGDGVIAVYASDGTEDVSLATLESRALCFPVPEISYAKAAAKGVTAIKLGPDDRVMAFGLARTRMDGVAVRTSQGRDEVIRPNKYTATRANKGRLVLKRDRFTEWLTDTIRLDEQWPAPEPPAGQQPLVADKAGPERPDDDDRPTPPRRIPIIVNEEED
ncbi:MAG: DNA topoisomerase IV subunit A [Alphaproteobacteria bacterium]|nr:DNA topoisomerase IV subunit A [Alphaproteobacteria bacterium]